MARWYIDRIYMAHIRGVMVFGEPHKGEVAFVCLSTEHGLAVSNIGRVDGVIQHKE